MTVSHRKFGDLLEEGIKRVHITRKKPIGYILDEFGYELRPDDASKGRHALGHWYYKKRIPANMEDVAKLAELIVTKSDVERSWLNSFLESAGYPEIEKLCDKFFLPESKVSEVSKLSETEQIQDQPHQPIVTEQSPLQFQKKSLQRPYALGILFTLSLILFFFLIRETNVLSEVNETPTSAHAFTVTFPISSESKITTTSFPRATITPAAFPITLTPDFSLLDGKCPVVSGISVFAYTSPTSFQDFLNAGGSFIALQSGFNALVQKKTVLKDGRIISSDLTGDGVPEVILSVVLQHGSVWQVLSCNSGRYEPLVDITDPAILSLRLAVDLNGDKLPEIVSYRQDEIDGVSRYEFFVQEWNGQKFVNLVDNLRFDDIGKRLPTDITDWNRNIANATVSTRDMNGDGFYEVVVKGGLITASPNCETRFERQFTETWSWSGKSFQLADRVYSAPIYRFQRSADGDLAFALNHFDSALTAYQDVILDKNLFTHDQYLPHLEYCRGISSSTNSPPIDNEQAQLMAYARWRILLINAIENSKTVQAVYQTLQEKFPEDTPGHAYAVIATAFWTEYQASHDLQKACETANLIAKAQKLYLGHTAENICFIP